MPSTKIHIYYMKQNTKDWIQHIAGSVLIASAIALAFVSFLMTQDIGAGPLTYIAEALSTALGLFGISVFVANRVRGLEDEIRQRLNNRTQEDPHHAEE